MITLKRHETGRKLTDTLTADGAALDLTGATVYLMIKKPDGTVVERTAVIVSASAGTVAYQFVGTDVDVAGLAYLEWAITLGNGDVLKIPGEGQMQMRVVEDIVVAAP